MIERPTGVLLSPPLRPSVFSRCGSTVIFDRSFPVPTEFLGGDFGSVSVCRVLSNFALR